MEYFDVDEYEEEAIRREIIEEKWNSSCDDDSDQL